jgi:hypothetical protein
MQKGEVQRAGARLDSGHLGCRLQPFQYRMVRENLLSARGWLNLAAEGLHGLLGRVDDWPSLLPVRPEQLVPSLMHFLVDRRTKCRDPLKTGLNTRGRRPDNDIGKKRGRRSIDD